MYRPLRKVKNVAAESSAGFQAPSDRGPTTRKPNLTLAKPLTEATKSTQNLSQRVENTRQLGHNKDRIAIKIAIS